MHLTALLVVEHAVRRGEDEVAELTRRKERVGPLLDLVERDVEARRDDTALVESANELDNNLVAAVIIDHFKLADVAYANQRTNEECCKTEYHRITSNRQNSPIPRHQTHQKPTKQNKKEINKVESQPAPTRTSAFVLGAMQASLCLFVFCVLCDTNGDDGDTTTQTNKQKTDDEDV